MDKETLIARLNEIEDKLRVFLLFDKQIPEWEADPEMASCLPDLYDRREKALDRYLLANGDEGTQQPLIPHDKITPKKVEAVAFIIYLELAENIPDALEMLSDQFDYHP